MPSTTPDLTIRPAHAGDRLAIERLAQLDSAHVPAGTLLRAEVDGELRAALPLGGGRPIADPFAPTAQMLALLAARADQLRQAARQTARARRQRRRVLVPHV